MYDFTFYGINISTLKIALMCKEIYIDIFCQEDKNTILVIF